MKIRSLRLSLLGLSTTIALAGCGGGVEIIYGPAATAAKPIAVAILVDADQQSVANRVSDGCAASTVEVEIRTVERERVRTTQKDAGMPKVADLQPEDYKKLAAALDVDGLIIGRAGGHDNLPLNRYEVTSLEMRVVDAKTGEIARVVSFNDASSIDDGFEKGKEYCKALLSYKK